VLANACAALVAAALVGCDAGPREPRSVLLVTLDTTRADVLAGDAASRALAPRAAALADEGLRFPRAYSVAPLTLPAHASLLTGLVPPRHGLRDNGRAALSPAAETLPELLAARGFDTAAFVSSVVLARGFGLAQGFATYDGPEPEARAAGHAQSERSARATAAAAAAWLAERDPARPFFLWVHFYDAHVPYRPAPEHLARAGGDAYRGEVAAQDEALGLLLDALEARKRARETLVVLTADHGESLGEHGEPTHGALCYEAALRVPLVFRFPGPPPAPGPARLASLVDLVPTLLERLALPVPEGLDGVPLFAPDAPAERGLYFESCAGFLNYGWSPLAGWLDARGKYLHSSAPEFYLPQQDPREAHELAATRAADCARAREHLAEVLARPALAPTAAAEDQALAAAIGALGYARGSAEVVVPDPLAPSALPSPRARAHELEPLLRAHALFESGRYGECRPLVEAIVRENPRHLLALDLLGLCRMHAGDFRAAVEAWHQRLALSETADTRLNLGLARLELGDAAAALREIEAALRLAPAQPEVLAAHRRALAALAR
jgi:arylsulfatase A-like enzyme